MAMKKKVSLEDQSGAALVIALVMIVVLTVIALASSLSSIFEIKLSGNKRGSTDAFYTTDGGIQATMANLDNLDSSTYILINTGDVPQYLSNQSIDSKLNGAPTFAGGLTFKEAPNVVVYHPTRTTAPPGFSAGSFSYQYFVIDSTGRDQTETDLLKSTCHITETVVRIMPSEQGGS